MRRRGARGAGQLGPRPRAPSWATNWEEEEVPLFFNLIQNLFQIHFKVRLKIFVLFGQITQHNKINSPA